MRLLLQLLRLLSVETGLGRREDLSLAVAWRERRCDISKPHQVVKRLWQPVGATAPTGERSPGPLGAGPRQGWIAEPGVLYGGARRSGHTRLRKRWQIWMKRADQAAGLKGYKGPVSGSVFAYPVRSELCRAGNPAADRAKDCSEKRGRGCSIAVCGASTHIYATPLTRCTLPCGGENGPGEVAEPKHLGCNSTWCAEPLPLLRAWLRRKPQNQSLGTLTSKIKLKGCLRMQSRTVPK